MHTVIFYLAFLASGLAFSLILPVLVAFGFEENQVGFRLLIFTGLGSFLAVATLYASQSRARHLSKVSSIYLAITGWLVLPLLTVPIFMNVLGLSVTDALFEAFSAFTTTAANQFESLEQIPNSMRLFRAQLQWLGGLATLLTFILIVTPSKMGGMNQFGGTSASSALFGNASALLAFCWKLTQAYLIVSILCFIALMFTGLEGFDSAVLAMMAVSSGGFLPKDGSLHDIAGLSGQFVLTVFLLIACTSVFWHRMLIQFDLENLRAHRESYFVLLLWLALAIYIFSAINAGGGGQAGLFTSNLAEGLFNAASVTSTSGLQSRPGIFALVSPAIILFVLMLGAGSYSTASGVKLYRAGGMIRQSLHEINMLIHPHTIRSRTFGSVAYDIQMMKAIWIVFLLAVALLIIGAGLMALSGLNFQAAFTVSIAAITNAGPAYGPEWAPQTEAGWPAYHDMGGAQKIVLVLLMLLGRVEIVMAIAALNLGYWLNR